MSEFDWVILAILGIGAYSGFKNGFIVELANTLSFLIALMVCFMFLELSIEIIKPWLPNGSSALTILMVAIVLSFLVVMVGIHFAALALRTLIRMILLGSVDSVAGAFLSCLKTLMLLSSMIYAAETVGLKPQHLGEGKSKLIPVVKATGAIGYKIVSFLVPFTDTVVEKFEKEASRNYEKEQGTSH